MYVLLILNEDLFPFTSRNDEIYVLLKSEVAVSDTSFRFIVGIFAMPPSLCVKQYAFGVRRACSFLQQKHQQTLKEIHFVDIDVKIIQEIQSAFSVYLGDSSTASPVDKSTPDARQLSSEPKMSEQASTLEPFPRGQLVIVYAEDSNLDGPFHDEHSGARPKHAPLYPFKEVIKRTGLDKTTFHLSSGFKVQVYTCDILATRVDAIVFGQDKALLSRSSIAKRIANGELSRLNFEKHVKEIKKKNKKIKAGDVFCIPVDGLDTRTLLMAVSPSWSPGVSLEVCKDGVRKCMANILIEATKMNIHSIALPALGSGEYLLCVVVSLPTGTGKSGRVGVGLQDICCTPSVLLPMSFQEL